MEVRTYGLYQFLTVIMLQRRWSERAQFFDKGVELLNQFGRLGRRHPPGSQPRFVDTAERQELPEDGDAFFGRIITIQVIAFAQMSAADKHPVDPLLKGEQDMMRRHTTTAHYPDGANIRRVLQTTDPSQVSSGVRSPGAEEADDFRFKGVVGHGLRSCGWLNDWSDVTPVMGRLLLQCPDLGQ